LRCCFSLPFRYLLTKSSRPVPRLQSLRISILRRFRKILITIPLSHVPV
jgi:hypothetical protein